MWDLPVGHVRVVGLLVHARAVPERGVVYRVAAPTRTVLILARTDCEHDAESASGTDEDVVRIRRAVDEIPLAKRTLFTLDDQKSLARNHEEVLLVGLPVVHRHGLAGPQDEEVEAELGKLGLALELTDRTASFRRAPACLACVEDVPAFPIRGKPVLGLDEWSLGDHTESLATCDHATCEDGPPEEAMSKLALSTTMTVDGVISVAEWYVSDGEHDRASRRQFENAAMLLGRKTYEGLAGYWSRETGPWADLLNPMPKYVASRTLQGSLDWNSRVIDGDLEDGVARLKEELDGDLILIGCGEVARALLAAGLIDELRFWVHPAVWGAGERPFQGAEQARLRLTGSETFDSGVTLLRYEPAAI
jgi:dihydrofolate reductase